MEWKNEKEPADAWRLTDDLHAEQGKGDPFAAAIRATRMSMVITDPRRPDNPIVFANNAFLRLSGYSREEMVGRNCRFLQGPETNRDTIDAIREAIENRTDFAGDILNYRKDGSTFWNALYICPVSNEEGELKFYFASLLDVTDRKTAENRVIADKDRFEQAVKERTHQLEQRTRELETALEMQKALVHEVDHRVKNNLQMVSSLILMQSRAIEDDNIKQSLRSMLERIEALSTVHRRLYQSEDVTIFDVSDFVRDLVFDLTGASGRNVQQVLDLQPMEVPAEKAAPLALMINELLTNTFKHAFNGSDAGTMDEKIGVKLQRVDGHYHVEVSDNGIGMNGASGNGSFGMRLIKSLARQLQADIEWENAFPGTRVTISLPAENENTNGSKRI